MVDSLWTMGCRPWTARGRRQGGGSWAAAPTIEPLLRAEGVLAGHRAGDGFLRRLVVVIEDLLVVRGLPVDEHAHQDAQVVGLVARDDAALDRVDDGARHRGLRRPEHLD